MSVSAADKDVLSDERCENIKDKIRSHQVLVQKEEAVAASEIITGGNIVDSGCLNSFDISLGLQLPNIDNLLDNFLNSLCNKANSVISRNVGNINEKLDSPIVRTRINSNYNGKSIKTKLGQNITNTVNETIPDIPVINKTYKPRTGDGLNDSFYK